MDKAVLRALMLSLQAPGFPGWSAGRRDGHRVVIVMLGVATPRKVWAVDDWVRAIEVTAA